VGEREGEEEATNLLEVKNNLDLSGLGHGFESNWKNQKDNQRKCTGCTAADGFQTRPQVMFDDVGIFSRVRSTVRLDADGGCAVSCKVTKALWGANRHSDDAVPCTVGQGNWVPALLEVGARKAPGQWW